MEIARTAPVGTAPTAHSGPHNTRESSFAAAATAAAAARGSAVNQCNGIFNVGGQTVKCNVTITNTFRANGSTTQVVCTDTGAAQTCTTTVGPPITTITQCNGSGNGGGGKVICTVTVINNIHASLIDSLEDTTIVQCVGSGNGGGSEPTINCSPANTPGAPTPPTVSQCNRSGNGGGGQRRVTCTVTGDEMTFPVTVDQCNGSGNGGGATVTCTTNITTNIIGGGGGGGGGNPPGGGGGGNPPGGGNNPPGGNPPGGDVPPSGDVPPGGPPPPGIDLPPSGGTPPDGSTPPGDQGPPSRGGGQLPFTGFDPGVTGLLGAFLLLAGMSLRGVAMRMTRRPSVR